VYYQVAEVSVPEIRLAENGVDFQRLTGSVTIPADVLAASIKVVPIDDILREGDEVVSLSLKPHANYWLGDPASATVTIKDNDPATNAVATITITNPTNGATFPPHTNILIEATAIDPRGAFYTVDFYAGTNKLGSSTIYTFAPVPPGTPMNHDFVWTNVPPGAYSLTVRGHDSLGATIISPPVQITVQPATTTSFVQRQLPTFYMPGGEIAVRLRAEPPAGTSVYAVEDRPPTNWAIVSITYDGVYDATTGKVKFGPFYDATARTFLYELRSPAGETGTKEFIGMASADGSSTPIGGQRTLARMESLTHPADNNPTNFIVAMNEVTAYGAAWKKGQTWPIGPNPIPIEYVTRAGALWKSGESYRFDHVAGEPPLCWVPSQVGAFGSFDPGDMSTRAAGNQVVRRIVPPSAGDAPLALTVSILAQPQPGVLSYAVEDQPPAGWVIHSADTKGEIDGASGRVRWLFHDAAARELRYQVRPQLEAGPIGAFGGTAAFDDLVAPQTIAIVGPRQIALPEAPKIVSISRSKDGTVLLIAVGDPGQSYTIEASVDMEQWQAIGSAEAPSDATFIFMDHNASTLDQRFYRVAKK